MALDVNEIRKEVNKLYRKNQVGGYLDTETYNDLAKKIQLKWFQKRLDAFESTRTVTKQLQNLKTGVFLSATKVDRVGATVTLPSDFWQLDSITVSTGYSQDGEQKTKRVQADEMTDADFDFADGSEAFKPSTMYPVYKLFNNLIILLPNSISEIGLSYIKYPDAPVWAYAVSGGREVYDSGNSTQFSIPDDGHAEVVDMFLKELAESTRDTNLFQMNQDGQ